MMDAQKAAADIFVDFDYKKNHLPKSEINWGYGLKEYPKNPCKICPKTFRPISTYGETNWE